MTVIQASAFLSPRILSTCSFISPNKNGIHRHLAATPGRRGIVPVQHRRSVIHATWVEQNATVTIEAEAQEVFVIYSDLTNLPEWSPWVKEVTIDPDDPLISRWKLGARGLSFDWNARMYAIDRGERIAWRSDSGLKNEGCVTFAKASEDTDETPKTDVTLSVKVDVPGFIASLFDLGFVKTFVSDTLAADLKRLRSVALLKRRERIANNKEIPGKATDAVEIGIERLRTEAENNK